MKPYFFMLTVTGRRTGAPIGKHCGVVFADSVDAAMETAWNKFGNDDACKLWVEEIPEDGIDFVIYKSEI